MGSFAYLWKEKGASAPPEKYDELDSRMLQLFRASGMMEVSSLKILGKSLAVISLPVMHEYGLVAYYNYFEDNFWENAGYDPKDHHFWSNKIGSFQFATAVCAAYALESQYTDGLSITMHDGVPVGNRLYAGWLNYLFDEKFPAENNDAWKVFQILHDLESSEWEYDRTRWNSFLTGPGSRSSLLGVYACMNGIDKVLSGEVNDDEDFALHLDDAYIAQVRELREQITRFRSESPLSRKVQLKALLQAVRDLRGGTGDPPAREKREETDAPIQRIRALTGACGCPVITVLLIAEAYGADFWDIWEKVRDVVDKRPGKEPDREPVEPIPTTVLFLTNPDDMVCYWTAGGDIRFSEQMRVWLVEVQEKYQKALAEDPRKEVTLPWILDLMEFVQNEYYRVFTFDPFFQETVQNLGDERYLALWKVCGELAHDPELLAETDKLFIPREEETARREGKKDHPPLFSPSPGRILKDAWSFLPTKLRENRGRMTMKRFMALMANLELRKEVFGF